MNVNNPLAAVLTATIRELAAERAARSDAETDRDAYRTLACAALTHAHDLTATVRRQTETIARLHNLVREPGAGRERRAA